MTTAWITREQLSGHTGRDLNFNPVADLYLEAACDCIRVYIDQQVDYEANDTIVLSGSGTNTLILPEMPIVSVASITKDDDTEAIDDTTYMVWGRSRVILTDGCEWLPTSLYTVVYSHGYALTAEDADVDAGIVQVPSVMRMRALEVAATALVSGTTGVGGVRSETIGRYQYEMDANSGSITVGLTEEQAYDVDKFRQEGVA